MKILDFGAGWKAFHTLKLRALGFDVTAWDFGRNFEPLLHDALALDRKYDVVMASNVVNVHSTVHGIERTIAQLAIATLSSGFCVVNYPESPRKFATLKPGQVRFLLESYFQEVDPVARASCPLWVCRVPYATQAIGFCLQCGDYTPAEIACANIRPVGAVGANALVPRFVLELIGQSLEQKL